MTTKRLKKMGLILVLIAVVLIITVALNRLLMSSVPA